MENQLVQIVDEQLSYNEYKSLFYSSPSGQYIVGPSFHVINQLKAQFVDIKDPFAKPNDNDFVQLVTYTTKKVIDRFIKVNQFLNFSEEDFQILKGLYQRFFNEVLYQSKVESDLTGNMIKSCFHEHYRRLRKFLTVTNGIEVFKKYEENPYLFEVVCAQYRAEFQIRLMGIASIPLIEPVLDIGCGQDAQLIQYFRGQGIQAFGIDRMVEDTEFTAKANWFEFTLLPDRWGTIISHMAFTNHFGHHFFRKDGNYTAYILKFMEIIKSLKVGGSFVFSPSIPFLEQVMGVHGNYRFHRNDEQTGWITRIQ
ncbi:class I SAM-dependent methyltransferase [Paenibacillus sp. TRM 82003]|nr:class I SAM-dependent methyltransferase [Paenibacillus sp. TRM 82003]